MSRLWFDDAALEVPPEAYATPLAETLRAAGHTGVKLPCGEGLCGGCTVLLDGTPVPSCVVPTARAIGRQVQGAGGLTAGAEGGALADRLAARGALQCGFCVPGLVASASALPDAAPGGHHDSALIRERLAGHLCRCTGYAGLVEAVRGPADPAACPPPRVDGPAKARGSLRYAADMAPPGALSTVLLTSRSPHALVEIAPGDALSVPGAVCVLGPADSPALRFCTNPHLDDPVLAPRENEVFAREARYVGDIVGLVVAENLAAAREMARRVVQTERPLPACTDPAIARAAGAPPVRLADASNVAYELAVGAPAEDVDAAMAAAVRVHTHRFEIGPGPVAAMERPAAVARWDGDRCQVWSTSQTPQVVQRRLTELLGLGPDAVEVGAVPLGGGFGLKEELFLEPAAAVASRACGGRPVLVEVTRAQLGALRRRHSGVISASTACAADGTMLARRVEVELDAGGEVGHSALVLENLLLVAAALYPVSPTRATGVAVLTNTPSSGAFRGYGAAEIAYALESHVDELARAYGADPIDYRRRHVLRAGQIEPLNGWPVASFASLETLDALALAAGTPLASPDPTGRWRRGRGSAIFSIVSAASSSAHRDAATGRCRVGTGGCIVVDTVVPDMGQGLHSTLASVAAQRLGVPVERVHVCQQRSDEAPVDEGTFASRGVYVSANAVATAADRLRELVIDAGTAVAGGDLSGLAGGDLSGLVGLTAEVTVTSEDNGLVVGGQLADVSVDTWTGRVVVDRVVSVHDVGRVIDPQLAHGQVVGGVMQGVGVALTERGRHPDGYPQDVHLLDQGLPTMLLEPEIRSVFVGDGRARGLLRAKGLGEAPLVGVAPAIGNAIRDAVGVRLSALPFTPEAVYTALQVSR